MKHILIGVFNRGKAASYWQIADAIAAVDAYRNCARKHGMPSDPLVFDR
jgi:hypothetical protein